ncbi:MAG TPA: YHS domain-containing protein [Cyanobacteria bacterium UBA8553]|nr:YHS domain-containing protein [Cyanobacteria bacterium UBA8553]
MAKDPICGMRVEKATALKSELGGQTYYFCSENCQRTFESQQAG